MAGGYQGVSPEAVSANALDKIGTALTRIAIVVEKAWAKIGEEEAAQKPGAARREAIR